MIQLGKKAIITAVSTLALFGAVLAGVALAGGEEFDPVHAPDWKAGYSFSYDATASISAVTDGSVAELVGLPAAGNLSFGPFPVKKEILSTQYEDEDGYPVYVSAATFPFSNLQSGVPLFDTFAGQQAFVTAERQHDLAPVPLLPDTSCRSNDCPGGGLNFLAGNDMSYLNFPLTADKRWEATIDLPVPILPPQLAGVDRMHVVGEVSGMETVDLGEFGETEAVRVDFAYTPVGLHRVLADYKQAAEDMGFEVERFNVQVALHEIVYYSDDLQAVVSQEYILYVFIDIAAKGEIYGEYYDESIYAEATARVQLKLTGANTDVAGEERTPLEILEIVGDPGLIADARGQGVGATPYSISLKGSHSHVNAADSPMVSFAMGLHGIEKLPAGTSAHFELLKAGKSVESSPMGDAVIVSIDEPGVYDAIVTVTGPDGVKTAKAKLVANWAEEVEAKCSLNLLGTFCEPHQFPVAQGLQSMEVFLEAQQTMPALLGDYMVIEYADHSTESFGAGTTAEYDASDLKRGIGDWGVSYESNGDYFARATYVISATYGSAPEAVVVHGAPSEPEGDNTPPGAAGFLAGALQGLGRVLESF